MAMQLHACLGPHVGKGGKLMRAFKFKIVNLHLTVTIQYIRKEQMKFF